MTEPFNAREPLATVSTEPVPEPRAKAPKHRSASKRHRGAFALLGRVVGALAALLVLLAVLGGIGLFAAYRHYNDGLPDLAGLQHYQPRQMSRVYAGDSRLLSELATERRIFVPYSAIPDLAASIRWRSCARR